VADGCVEPLGFESVVVMRICTRFSSCIHNSAPELNVRIQYSISHRLSPAIIHYMKFT
jgi:hypothetical protein